MKRIVAAGTLLVGLVGVASGQSGVVRYTQANRIDITLPPNMPRNPEFMANIPRSSTRAMELKYTASMALFAPSAAAAANARPTGEFAVRVGGGSLDGPMMVREVTPEMMQMGRTMGFVGGDAGDAISGAFTELESGDYVEVREFLGRTFRIPTERPSFPWRLTGEAASFLGYPVYQAIAQVDSSKVEAWFTPAIPVSAGPAQYGGLPGLILTLAVDSNRVVYTATAIDTTAPVGTIKAPSDGSKVTKAEYDTIVAEKRAELQRSRRGRGNN
jgi:hypothetical protein